MNLALALCGGGSKGSYQLGALKALKELNYEYDIICATSIGTLNGLMVFQNDYEKLENIWNNISLKDVINFKGNYENKDIKSLFNQKEDLVLFFKDYLNNFGVDILPLKEMLLKNIEIDCFKNNKTIFGVVVCEVPKIKKKEIVLNSLSKEYIFNYLIASCSCFPFFPIHKINSNYYIDGGYLDNLPIDFCFKLGADEIIAIDLNNKITHKKYLLNDKIKYIYPKISLGSFMSFDKNVHKKNEILGYFDVYKYFKKYNGVLYTFVIEDYLDYKNRLLNKYHLFFDLVTKENKKNKEKIINKLFAGLDRGYLFEYLNNEEMFYYIIESIGLILKIDYTKIYTLNNYFELVRFSLSRKNNKVYEKIDLNKKNIFKGIDYIDTLIIMYDLYKNEEIPYKILFDVYSYKKEVFLPLLCFNILKK